MERGFPFRRFDVGGAAESKLPELIEATLLNNPNVSLPDRELIESNPQLADQLKESRRALRRIEQAARTARGGDEPDTGSNDADASELPRIRGYRIIEAIARGGQGVIFRAIQAGTGREVAVKVLRDGPLSGTRDRARFEREVRMLGSLRHPHIVTIHESGVTDGRFYFVMDYVQGVHLDAFFPKSTPVRRKLELLAMVCDAVHAAHLKGIIHRDLKPSNVLVDANGVPHILDFGLAKSSGELSGMTHAHSLTLTGQFLGSLPWSSPEQAAGDAEQTDSRTDIYSLGVVLYQLVVGQFPYPVTGRMREVITHIVETEPVRPSKRCHEANKDIETIILKCLAKNPQRRYQSAGDVAQDIRRHLAGEPIDARRDSTLYVLGKHLRKHRMAVGAGLGFLVLLIASSVVAWTLYARSQNHLWSSYLAQAKSSRVTRLVGQRSNALAALQGATAIQPTFEVRNEVIAALALPDLRILRQWDVEEGWYETFFSPDLSHYALLGQQYLSYVLRQTIDHQEHFRTKNSGKGYGDAVFNPDGRYCAVPCEGKYRVWDTQERQWIFEFDAERFVDGCLDFSPDSSLLVYCAPEAIRLYRWKEGTLESISYDGARHFGAKFSPDGASLATWSHFDQDVVVYGLNSRSVRARLPHTWALRAVAWHPKGDLLATGGGDRQVQLWDPRTGEHLHAFTEPRSLQAWLDFNADGTVLMAAGWDSTTYFWDVQSRVLLLQAPGQSFHFDSQNRLGRVSQAAGKTTPMIVQFEPGTLQRHVLNPLGEVTTDRFGIALIPPGRILVSCREDGVFFYDLLKRDRLGQLDIGSTHNVVWNEQRSSLITCGPRGVHEWSVEVGPEDLHIASPQNLFANGAKMERVHCSLNGDGTQLAIAASETQAVVLSMNNPKGARRIGHHDQLRFLALSPDGSRLATSTWHGTQVKVWDTATGELRFELHASLATRAFFSPEGTLLITSSGQENCAWDAETGLKVRCVARTDRPGLLGAILLSPDRRTLLLQDQQNVLQLLDPRTWDVLARFELPDNAQAAYAHVAFTPDGAGLIATTESGSLAYAWDLREIRRQLAAMGLDWPQPPLPGAANMQGTSNILRLTIEPHELLPDEAKE